MKRKCFKIPTIFFLAVSLLAFGVIVANCHCDPSWISSRITVLGRGSQAYFFNVVTGKGRQNQQHDIGQCRGTGLCHGFLGSGKVKVHRMAINPYAVAIASLEGVITAGIGGTSYPGKPSPQYILNLSLLC